VESYVKQVEGKVVADVMLYALSTCVWCRKTKTLLSELGVAYRYVDVDLLTGAARQRVMDEVQRWNPNRAFPVVVINNKSAIGGFDELAVKAAVASEG